MVENAQPLGRRHAAVCVACLCRAPDVELGFRPSHRRLPRSGALVSRDNGFTWDLSRELRLHEFDFATAKEGAHEGIGALACGHTCSTLLKDGSILTAYGHYISKGIALIRWKLPATQKVLKP